MKDLGFEAADILAQENDTSLDEEAKEGLVARLADIESEKEHWTSMASEAT